jgi:uncharacterized membrane protein YdjX (TVP38/TMEM64 family)
MTSRSTRIARWSRAAALATAAAGAVAATFVARVDLPAERGLLFDLAVDGPTGRTSIPAFAPGLAAPNATAARVRVPRDSALVERLCSPERLREVRASSGAGDAPTDARLAGSLTVVASADEWGDLAIVDAGEGPGIGVAASNVREATALVAGGARRERFTLWQALRAPNGSAALAALVRATLDRLGWIGPLAYVALYVVGSVLALPGVVLTVAGALAFGLWKGLALVVISSNLGASAAFAFARFVARDALERRLPARLRELDRRLETQGVRAVILLRLVPAFPFNAINFACGLSRIRYEDFAVGTLVGMIPGTFLWMLAATSAARFSASSPVTWAPVGLFVLLLFAPHAWKRWRARRSARSERFARSS